MLILCDWWLSRFEVPDVIEIPVINPITNEPTITVRPLVYFVAGAVGGMLSTIVGHPLDTVKANLQAVPAGGEPAKYTGVFDCTRKIIKTQGIRGLYKGLGVNITSSVPSSAVNFSGYGLGKSLQEKKGKDHDDFTAKNFFVAGAVSGFLTALTLVPGERVKLLLQLHSDNPQEPKITYEDRCKPRYNGAVDVIVKLYQEGGVRNIFKGTLSSMMRDVPGYATYFMTYEVVKLNLDRTKVDEPPLQKTINTTLAGGLAGIAFWLVAIPGDNIRSRLQLSVPNKYPNGLRDVLKEIYKSEPITSLYRGLMPVLLRTLPSSAACFLGYEYSKTFFSYILN